MPDSMILRCILRSLIAAVLVMCILAASPTVRASGVAGTSPTSADQRLVPATKDTDGKSASIAVLRHAGHESFRLAVRDVYGDVEGRVPDYGAWVYGWLSSLWTSAEVAADAVTGMATALLDGAEPPFDRAERYVTERVRGHFENMVLRPEETNQRLRESWGRAVTLTQDLGRKADISLPPAPPFPLEGAAHDAADAQSSTILVRTVRPMGARVLSLAVRFGAAGSLGAMAAPSIAASSAIADYVLSSAIASVAVWGVDWSVNAIDAALHREDFEADLLLSVRLQERETRDRLQAAFDAWLDAAAAPPSPGPSPEPLPEPSPPLVIRTAAGSPEGSAPGTR